MSTDAPAPDENIAVRLKGEETKVNPDNGAEKKSTYRMEAEGVRYDFIGRAIGTHLEQNNANGGKRVESQPAEGGKAVSETAGDGSYRGELTGPLLRGQDGEPHALRILAAKLRSLGHEVTVLPAEKAENARGEDGKLLIDRVEHVVQIVTMPVDNGLWKALGIRGAAETVGQDAVKLVRACIEKKCNKAKGTILVLDAAHIGAVPSQDLVDAYIKAHGNPNQECGFAQTWIVGPTEARTFRVG